MIFTKYPVYLLIATCLLSEVRAEEPGIAPKPELRLSETKPVIASGAEVNEGEIIAAPEADESTLSVIEKSNQKNEALAKMASIEAVSDDGEDMICDPDELLEAQVEGGLELAMFNCQKLSEKVVAPTSDERGRGETESLKNQILQEQGKVEQSVVIVRTDTASEADADTSSANVAVEKETKVAPTPITLAADATKRLRKFFPLKFYLSLRGSFDDQSQDVKSLLNDGKSRFGLLYYHQGDSGWNISAQGEWGVRVLDSGSNLDEQLDTQTRLLYAAISNDNIEFTYGKNWGVYYSVASMTDRFLIFGGHSTGVYQAGSDGGSAGTGRAGDAPTTRRRWVVGNRSSKSPPNCQPNPNRSKLVLTYC